MSQTILKSNTLTNDYFLTQMQISCSGCQVMALYETHTDEKTHPGQRLGTQIKEFVFTVMDHLAKAIFNSV